MRLEHQERIVARSVGGVGVIGRTTYAPMKRLAACMGLLTVLGCEPDLGQCDQPLAEALVYDLDGQPAFEGQALVIQSCGSGGFCHSEGIAPTERNGAPAGLELDLQLASQTPDVAEDALARLGRSQANAYYLRHLIYGSVTSGQMPPGTDAPIGRIEYQRVPEGATEGPPLPSLATDEGQAILRNWLACGAPVVERTLPRTDGNDNTVGQTHAVIETTPVEPVWSQIYPRIIERSCAFTMCHDAESTAGGLDMSTAALALQNLRGDAAGRLCGESGRARIVPGDEGMGGEAQSLLLHKLRGLGPDGPVCGERMPSLGNYLSEDRINAIETWIRNGANDD